jgi:hypothetical protein
MEADYVESGNVDGEDIGDMMDTFAEIVEEVFAVKLIERATRLIDGANEDSMEKKKTEGKF